MFIAVVIIGAVCAGISGALSKKLSTLHNDKLLALIYQYISVVFFALILNCGFMMINNQDFLPVLSWNQWLVIIGTGIIGYAGIYCLFQAFHRISAGIALVVANMATFIMYFLNIYLIDGDEVLTSSKLLLSLVFFIVVSLLLLAGDTNKKFTFNSGIFFALGTAVCWALYFSANTYFIKSQQLLPVQSLFVTELGVALCAWFVYRYRYRKRSLKVLLSSYHHSDLLLIIGIGFFLMISILCIYYGYQYLWSSLVNVIKLFSIVVTTISCWLWFGEKLSKREVILMSCAFVVLIAFVGL
jgi:drug/metabolite transporter (DMT)-like permease